MIKNNLRYATNNKCSDVIIAAQNPPMIRINGDLIAIPRVPILNDSQTSTMMASLMSEQQKQIFAQEMEMDFAIEIADGTRFRVNAFKTINGTSAAFRIIKNNIRDLQNLNAPKALQDLLRLKQGLILMTGPTGCGKSTTLAAMIDYVNTSRSVHIVTMEDPIEFLFKPKKSIIKQRQLHTDMNTFESALIHVLRQDPNVIMVGEMRNLETIAATVTLAETGHLVLATLHTHNAAQTID